MTADDYVVAQMGGPAARELRFVVPGRPSSNNRNHRNFRGVSVKSSAATVYQSRVAQYALLAAKQSDWRWAPCVRVRVVHWNGRLDTDNVPKAILDGMKGIVFPDDRRRFVRGSVIDADVDGGDEYVEIIVTACDPLPEVVRRKCHFCLDSRAGVRQKPFVCGRCAQRRKKALVA